MNKPSELMQLICNDPRFGYSQGSNRWGNEKVACFNIDGKDYYINEGDRDCSSAIISVYNSVYPNEHPFGIAYYTGNMIECAMETGKWQYLGKITNTTGLKAGDVLVRDGHTEMYVGNGKVAGFRSNENGGIIGGLEGDQTGNESSIVNFFSDHNNPWQGIRYIGDSENNNDNENNSKWPKLFKFLNNCNVYTLPDLNSEIVAEYDKDETVYLNGNFIYNDDCIFAEYNASKTGVARYVIFSSIENLKEV